MRLLASQARVRRSLFRLFEPLILIQILGNVSVVSLSS